MLSKFIWCLKQLLPLTYVGKEINENGKQLCVWRMWFGKPFHIKWYELKWLVCYFLIKEMLINIKL